MWLREGECNRCGDCCRSGNPFTGEPGTCPIAQEMPDGTIHCTDRTNHYYMIGCRFWPSMPEHIVDYPRCSYTFKWVEDGN